MVASEPWKKSPVTPPGIDTGTDRLVAQYLNHYATPGPYITMYRSENMKYVIVCIPTPNITPSFQSKWAFRDEREKFRPVQLGQGLNEQF